jgi:hypothetical protein
VARGAIGGNFGIAAVDVHGVGVHHADFRPLAEAGNLKFELARHPQIIGVAQGNQLTFGGTDAGITRARFAAVFLVVINDPGIIRVGLHDLARIVLGAIVDDMDFQVLVRLAQDGIDRLRHVLGRVVGRHDHAD